MNDLYKYHSLKNKIKVLKLKLIAEQKEKSKYKKLYLKAKEKFNKFLVARVILRLRKEGLIKLTVIEIAAKCFISRQAAYNISHELNKGG